MELTPQEEIIIKLVRELVPYETLTILKDQLGRPNRFLVTREAKLVITDLSPTIG